MPSTTESATGSVPLVVLVPGGAWETADPAGLVPLADMLGANGIEAVPVTVRAASDGVVYPVPVEDVVCAAVEARDRIAAEGRTASPLVLYGHSSGAHLASLAALAPDDFATECGNVVVDGLIGVSGIYDVFEVPDLAVGLFGVTGDENPSIWSEGNPVERAGERPDLPVLLLHGDADPLVPVAFTEEFADALRAGGHLVTVTVLPGADHHLAYRPETSGAIIADWVRRLGE